LISKVTEFIENGGICLRLMLKEILWNAAEADSSLFCRNCLQMRPQIWRRIIEVSFQNSIRIDVEMEEGMGRDVHRVGVRRTRP
jgi:hypothetical protein